MTNPFSITFGKEPDNYISRFRQTEEIIDNLTSEKPSISTYMITGVRGSGKTVFLSAIAKRIAAEKGWYAIELNPTRDMLSAFAARLCEIPELKLAAVDIGIDISVFGARLSLEKTSALFDIESMIDKLLEIAVKLGKRILITVDEAVNNKYISVFASSYQIMLRHDYPVFVIMTGLYENINLIQNNKSLTFLYRTPKIILDPLNVRSVADSYKKLLGIESKTANELAGITKGYPFAYQVLGYIYWNSSDKKMDDILAELDRRLEEYVYEKIWNESSTLDREIIAVMTSEENINIREVREKLNMSPGKFNIYRNRLLKKGIVISNGYGQLSFCLPRFAEIVRSWLEAEESGIIQNGEPFNNDGNVNNDKRDIAEIILSDLVAKGMSGEELLIEFHKKYSRTEEYKQRIADYNMRISKL